MSKTIFVIVLLVLLSSLFISSCTPGQAFGPTITPVLTTTSTPMPTATSTSTPAPTATTTPFPTPTFPVGSMSNPAMEVIDLSVTVDGDLVTATFYLKDVPEEMDFQRSGMPDNMLEYSWAVYFDTDNNMNTGYPYYFSGADYKLDAMNQFSQYSDLMNRTGISNKGSQPIEKGIQMVYISDLDENGGYVSSGTIEVDPEANTITLSGSIPGITNHSKVYFETFDYNPGYKIEKSVGQLIDRVVIK